MLKSKIWIMNHYATNSFFNKGGRHYWFAKNLIENGYEPTIFCANTRHNSEDIIEIYEKKFVNKAIEGIPYVFVKTVGYKSNGIQRIRNMVGFYKNLFPVAKEYSKIYGKPDVMLASSVHPLTLVAGIKIAKKFGVPCICEIRDLWPESIFAFGSLKRSNIVAKLLYQGEKWIYKKADKLIFTMEGGKDYIIEHGWNEANGGPINLDKVYHINNGIDLEEFDFHKQYEIINDTDLENDQIFKVVYTGSIRKANKVEKLIDVAKVLEKTNIKFLIWGDGDQVNHIKKRIENERINSVVLKGIVEKKYIPYIISKADLNIISGDNIPLYKYGVSLNKMFEYLASRRPVLSTFTMGYDIIKKFNAGITLSDQSVESIRDAIVKIANMDKDEYLVMCNNARKAAEDYDFKILTKNLIQIIENL